jgi:outer membrane protein assembly factor BamB
MFGRDAQHSGYNSDDQGSPSLTEAWAVNLLPPNQSQTPVHPVVADDGLVFATLDVWAGSSSLIALHLDDGTPAWSYGFGSIYTTGHPSVVGGVVYLGNGQGGSGEMWAFHSLAGTTVWQATFGAQFEHYFAPLVTTNYVYADTGYGGGLSAFAVSDGSTKFFNSTIGQYDSWSPAQFGGKIFTFIAGYLRAHDPLDGSVSWTTSVTWNWNGYSMNTAPVFDSSQGYIIAPPTLYAIDPSTHQVAWQAGGGYTGTPAVAGGVVFGTSSGNLIARSSTDGSLLWTFSGDGALSYPPVVANGTVYCASNANVYAVSISGHNQVWTAAVGGWLAIASRRLLVATNAGTLHAFLMSK